MYMLLSYAGTDFCPFCPESVLEPAKDYPVPGSLFAACAFPSCPISFLYQVNFSEIPFLFLMSH